MKAVDLFAGPGGWDVAARELGLDVVGIEIDAAACATRRAAGLATIEGDIRDHSPAEFPLAVGLIASPPCQTFSAAGKGAGRLALDTVLLELKRVANGEAIDYAAFSDERTGLVLEPLRWIRDAFHTGGYEWVALEQVPAVLPVWEAYAEALREWGYSVDVGKLSAEQYGVPQTRKRALLVAHRRREVRLPAPTHTAYVKGRSRFAGTEDGLIPWISMAEALGWIDGVAGFPRRSDGLEETVIDGVAYRARDLRDVHQPAQAITEKTRSWVHFPGESRWMVGAGAGGAGRPRPSDEPAPTIAGGGAAAWIDDPERWYGQDSTHPGPGDVQLCPTNLRPNSTLRDLDEPAATLAFGHERPQWVVSTGANQHLIGPGQREGTDWRENTKGYERPIDAPAPTVDAKAGSAWKVHPEGERPPAERYAAGEPVTYVNGTHVKAGVRAADDPAPTVMFGARLNSVEWASERPATTVPGDPRIWPPGHKVNADDRRRLGEAEANEKYGDRAGKWSVRVSLEEAAVLQSFPADYPWQGTKTKRFQQIGNAVPPRLAAAVLRQVIA